MEQIKNAKKIIDFEKKGNVVRFYLGKEDLQEWHGDDWDDAPYEHNAGTVYNEYVTQIVDIGYSFDYLVMEPADDWRNNCNSRFSKKDLKEGKTPCIIVVPLELTKDRYYSEDDFSFWVGAKGVIKFYLGDLVNDYIFVEKEADILYYGYEYDV